MFDSKDQSADVAGHCTPTKVGKKQPHSAKEGGSNRHVAKLLKRIEAAHQAGKHRRDIYPMILQYLGSYDACLLAVQRASRKLKGRRRPDRASQAAIAAKIDACRGFQEDVSARYKLKRSGSSRLTMEFGTQ